ncbi:hypothetical protein ACH5RR_009455 [Cinchona calisaya]|uniref:DUF4283 domain-containing protein n=1 Tax=Cinchona calisaya TaxID=153742 RepID=A0ABD3AIE9_9GENT
MAEDLVEIFEKFELSGKEIGGLELGEGNAKDSVPICRRSLIRRIMGERMAIVGVKNFCSIRWGYPKKLEIIELGVSIFQFTFGNQMDLERVLNTGPWLFDNQLLVVK